jgi:hypothetical protein
MESVKAPGRRTREGLVLASALLFACPASAREWSVRTDGSGDAPTIQAAIAAAAPGDRVVLEAGIFTGPGNRDVDFLGKAITVTSAAGAEATVIDCQGLGRGFVFQSGEDLNSLLEQVTVTGGIGRDLGSGNFAGGGVACLHSSSPLIRDCHVIGNQAEDIGGGIACVDQSSPWILGNRIIDNDSHMHGGGVMALDRSSPVIRDNLIKGNSASRMGGGLSLANGALAVVTGNVICENIAEVGGGVDCGGGTPLIEGNVIFDNVATRLGGGVQVSLASPTLRANTIVGNGAPSGGGIACFYYGNAVIEYCIIAFSAEGGGMFTDAARPVMRCTDIFGNEGGNYMLAVDLGGNFRADPLFCGVGDSGNFRLQATSPCLPSNNSCGMPIGAQTMGCGTTPVTRTTWGVIKSRYRR